ncbi:YciI family protein [Robertkochia aurantiaca]|uniref:YciI family protein n=1 Tax=Robertkochia aurantiaca TaxID=2873700 RepID=UPI001CCEA6C5|nr:YciI family protein [Robertkochia sp. 3YJGBD-33]
MRTIITTLTLLLLVSCQQQPDHKELPTEVDSDTVQTTSLETKKKLEEEGYQVFDYIDEKTKDTILMQQYFMAFLKSGPNRSQTRTEADSLQRLHLAHLSEMYEKGYASISGPFGDDGEIRGITIYNVPTLAMADSLANADPMVKAGRLVIEVHPWWAAKGFPLR